MMDSVVAIYQLTSGTKNTYQLSYSNVRAWIIPASTESIALYDNMPQGQTFEYRIVSDAITALQQKSKLVIKNSQMSGFSNGDTFITVADPQRTRIGGKFYLVGVCYKAET